MCWGRDFALFECKRVARFFACDVDADERADWIDSKRRESWKAKQQQQKRRGFHSWWGHFWGSEKVSQASSLSCCWRKYKKRKRRRGKSLSIVENKMYRNEFSTSPLLLLLLRCALRVLEGHPQVSFFSFFISHFPSLFLLGFHLLSRLRLSTPSNGSQFLSCLCQQLPI